MKAHRLYTRLAAWLAALAMLWSIAAPTAQAAQGFSYAHIFLDDAYAATVLVLEGSNLQKTLDDTSNYKEAMAGVRAHGAYHYAQVRRITPKNELAVYQGIAQAVSGGLEDITLGQLYAMSKGEASELYEANWEQYASQFNAHSRAVSASAKTSADYNYYVYLHTGANRGGCSRCAAGRSASSGKALAGAAMAGVAALAGNAVVGAAGLVGNALTLALAGAAALAGGALLDAAGTASLYGQQATSWAQQQLDAMAAAAELAVNDSERPYSAIYSYPYYRSANPDLQAAFGDDRAAYLQHFLNTGMAEGRQGCAGFNVHTYRAANPDLAATYGGDLPAYYRHYMASGQAEGRRAS